MAIRSKEDEAIAVLPDAAAGVYQDVIADQRTLNGGPRPHVAVPADPDIGADHGTRPDHRPGADFDVWADHRKRIDDQAVLQMRAGIDDARRRDTGHPEPGLRAKGIAVQRARDFHKFAERMGRAQNRDMGGDAGLETRADQTR